MRKRMRIAIVSNTAPPTDDELERQIFYDARALAQRGHEVLVLAGSLPGKPGVSAGEVDGVSIIRIPELSCAAERWRSTSLPIDKDRVAAYVNAYERTLSAFRPDVIDARGIGEVDNEAATALFKLYKHLPLFLTPVPQTSKYVRGLRWTRQFAGLRFSSPGDLKQVPKRLPMGVDLDLFYFGKPSDPGPRKFADDVLGAGFRGTSLLMLDGLDDTNDHMLAIDVAEKLGKPGSVALIFSDPVNLANPERREQRLKEVWKHAKAKGVTVHIAQISPPQRRDAMLAASAILVSSTHELNPLTAVEAAVVGKTVVYTRKQMSDAMQHKTASAIAKEVRSQRRTQRERTSDALAEADLGRLEEVAAADSNDRVDELIREYEGIRYEPSNRSVPTLLRHLIEQPGTFRKELAVPLPDLTRNTDPAKIDFVAVSTLGTTSWLEYSVETASKLDCPLVIFCKSKTDVERITRQWKGRVPRGICVINTTPFSETELGTVRAFGEAFVGEHYNLAANRNLTLILARVLGPKVLQLDEDVFGISAETIEAAATYVGPGDDQLAVVAFPVIQHPDHGFVNEQAENAVADLPSFFRPHERVFVGGGAQVMYAPKMPPTDIGYNEDLRQLFDIICKRQLGIMGDARQLFTPQSDSSRRPLFQEWLDTVVMTILDEMVSAARNEQLHTFRWEDIPASTFERAKSKRLLAIAQLWMLVSERENTFHSGRRVVRLLEQAVHRLAELPTNTIPTSLRRLKNARAKWRSAIESLAPSSAVEDLLSTIGIHDYKMVGLRIDRTNDLAPHDKRVINEASLTSTQQLLADAFAGIHARQLTQDESTRLMAEFARICMPYNQESDLDTVLVELDRSPTVFTRHFGIPRSVEEGARKQFARHLKACYRDIDSANVSNPLDRARLQTAIDLVAVCSGARVAAEETILSTRVGRTLKGSGFTSTARGMLFTQSPKLPPLVELLYTIDKTSTETLKIMSGFSRSAVVSLKLPLVGKTELSPLETRAVRSNAIDVTSRCAFRLLRMVAAPPVDVQTANWQTQHRPEIFRLIATSSPYDLAKASRIVMDGIANGTLPDTTYVDPCIPDFATHPTLNTERSIA